LVLTGMPTQAWTGMAEAALNAGYTAEQVLEATEGHSHAYMGRDSGYWEQWRTAWEQFEESASPRIRGIARLGIARASQRRDRALEVEAVESITGSR
jgi:hypothetical protein